MKNLLNRNLCLLIFGAIAISLPVSSLTAQDEEGNDYEPPEAANKGTYRVTYSNAPDTLNPITANDTTSGSIVDRTVESFATRSMQDPSKFEPRLAKDWEVSEDGMTYTLHLREGVKFHPIQKPDGTVMKPGKFTAYDAKFSYEVVMNSGVEAGSTRNYLKRIESFEVVDKHTIKVKWGEPYFNAKGVTLSYLSIIPENVYAYDENDNVLSHNYSSPEFAKKFNRHWANNKVCGTGPYRLKKWERGDKFILTRWEDYYREKPNLNKIVMEKIQQPITRYREFLSGNLTRIGMPPHIFKEKYLKSDSWEKGKKMKKGDEYKEGASIKEKYDYPAYRYIGWNQRLPMFEDVKVRRALTHAVPRQDIIDEHLYGLARITTGPFFFKTPAYNDNVKPYEYDLEKARKLLTEAGWTDDDNDGIREKEVGGKTKKFEFRLLHYADSPTYKQIAQTIRSRFKRIGVMCNPSATKWNSFLTKLDKRDFQACMLGWALGWVSDPYQLFHSSQAVAKGGSNYVGWTSKKADKLIEEIRVTMDEEKRRKLYHKFHKLCKEQQPYTFLWTTKSTAAHQSYLHETFEKGPSQIPHYAIRPCVDTYEFFYPKTYIKDKGGD